MTPRWSTVRDFLRAFRYAASASAASWTCRVSSVTKADATSSGQVRRCRQPGQHTAGHHTVLEIAEDLLLAVRGLGDLPGAFAVHGAHGLRHVAQPLGILADLVKGGLVLGSAAGPLGCPGRPLQPFGRFPHQFAGCLAGRRPARPAVLADGPGTPRGHPGAGNTVRKAASFGASGRPCPKYCRVPLPAGPPRPWTPGPGAAPRPARATGPASLRRHAVPPASRRAT